MRMKDHLLAASQGLLLAVAGFSGNGFSQVNTETSAYLEPRELAGVYMEISGQNNEGPFDLAEDGSAPADAPFTHLPVIDVALQNRIGAATDSEQVRVIIYLRHLPQYSVAQHVLERHASARHQIDADIRRILQPAAELRDTSLPRDIDNLAALEAVFEYESEALRPVHERHEALSLTIKNEMTTELQVELAPHIQRVQDLVELLGGEFEFSTIAGSTVVAKMPLFAIEELAEFSGILRITEDVLAHSHLDNAASATRVDVPGGLWAAGQDGGIYDPAIIDSGTDLAHPAMQDSVSPARANFSTWYLVAANGSANFGDEFSPDDLQGHGTHVAGITGSYGSAAWPTRLGLSFGVEKLVTLKAGWLNTSNGRASMFWSDKYNVVERALNNTPGLSPSDFNDDVDGMNLSYGGTTTLDDTDAGRFWDSVISSYADLPVTISAGNTGPNNANFNDPAVSYNAIAVANLDDQGTLTLDDDAINAGSSVGPTASNRRKPDIAAPGTAISAPNNDWETEPDFVNKTGTSMAAPAVLGVVMDLMDAGVLDELTLKALLINTAQKNLPGADIENDSDGWDPALGWGVLNAESAYLHRFDNLVDSVTPRLTNGDFQLYKGVMRDEGPAGEGRDRATMVWNRAATYNPAAAPTTFYSLVDLNLRLYRESDEFLIDSDLDGNDNVHQVRIGSNAPETDVIINAYAWSTTFSHGGATQGYAISLEENFTRVDLPSTFQGIAIWPSSVEPNEVFDIEFWLRNDSEIASHDNVFDLNLPAGFSLISGTDTQNVGSIQGGGQTSAHVNYTLRAPASPIGATSVTVAHSHHSYNEPYGNFNWNINLTVEVDNTPPTPNPMSFSTDPYPESQSEIGMTASFASDLHDPVEYYLDFTSSPTAGSGGSDSGWQPSRNYTDAGLQANHRYCYRAWARDNANNPNLTDPSPIECIYTLIETAGVPIVGTVTTSSINLQSQGSFTNLDLLFSGLEIRNLTNLASSGWFQAPVNWTNVSLSPNTEYTYVTSSRNSDGVATDGPPVAAYTLANVPAPNGFTGVSHDEVTVLWTGNGNPGGTEYLIQNTTLGTNSGWIMGNSWTSTDLSGETTYSFQGRARNSDGIETGVVSLGSIMTTETPIFEGGFEDP